MKKKKIITKEDKFLEKAEIVSIEPLHAGTGYCAGRITAAFPDIDPKEAWNLINQKFHQGVFPESKAVEEVIEELKQRKKK